MLIQHFYWQPINQLLIHNSWVDTTLELNITSTDIAIALALKSNKYTTYTQWEIDTSFALTSNQATTYTKPEMIHN